MKTPKINPALRNRFENKKRTKIQLECFNRLAVGIQEFPAAVQRQSILAYWELIKP